MRASFTLTLWVVILAAGCVNNGGGYQPPTQPEKASYFVALDSGAHAPLPFELSGAVSRLTATGVHAVVTLGAGLRVAANPPLGPFGGGARVELTSASGTVRPASGSPVTFQGTTVFLHANASFDLAGLSGARLSTARSLAWSQNGSVDLALADFPAGPPGTAVPGLVPATFLDAAGAFTAGPVSVTVDNRTFDAARVEFAACHCGVLADRIDAASQAVALRGVETSTGRVVSAVPLGELGIDAASAPLRLAGREWTQGGTLRVVNVTGDVAATGWHVTGTAVQLLALGGKPEVASEIGATSEKDGASSVSLTVREGDTQTVYLRVRETSGVGLAVATEPRLEGGNGSVRVSTTRLMGATERSAQQAVPFVFQPWVAGANLLERVFLGDKVDLAPGETGFVGVAVEAPKGSAGVQSFAIALHSSNAATASVAFQVTITPA